MQATSEWLWTLCDGYKQADAPLAKLATVEDRMFSTFPNEALTTRVRNMRWAREHPAPREDAGAEEWGRYLQLKAEASEQGLKQAPKSADAWQSALTAYQSLPTVPKERAVQIAEGTLRMNEETASWPESKLSIEVAEFYLRLGIETPRAAELLERQRASVIAKSPQLLADDALTPKRAAEYKDGFDSDLLEVNTALLRAYEKLGAMEKAATLERDLLKLTPGTPENESMWWHARALLARMRGQRADVLAYLQTALQVRPLPPARENGRVPDQLMDDARALWKQLNGTQLAFVAWSTPRMKRASSEGQWEKPAKPLAPFELADMAGKTWNLRTLEGKTVFVNFWATWCAYCLLELPHVQEFYEQNKDRTDVAIITLDADEEIGLVAPFLKEHGYTFPVLPAYQYLNRTQGGWGIPQNWIADSKGQWQWVQMGYNEAELNWEKTAREKLESVMGGARESAP